MLILGQYGVVFACVFKDTNMTCTCFGPDKKLKPAYSTQKPSYSLLSSHISQVVTCLPQREQNYSFLYTHSIKTQQKPNTASNFQTRTNLHPAFSRREPTYTQHPPDENQTQILHTRAKHSQHLPGENQTQPASSRQEPKTASIFQTRTKHSQRANIQSASFIREPTYSQHPPSKSQTQPTSFR